MVRTRLADHGRLFSLCYAAVTVADNCRDTVNIWDLGTGDVVATVTGLAGSGQLVRVKANSR